MCCRSAAHACTPCCPSALQESTLEDIQATTACVSTNGKIPCMSKIGVPVMRDVVLV